MKRIKLSILIILTAVAACKQSASPTVDDNRTDTGFKQMPQGAIDTYKHDTLPAMDTTRLVVDSMVNVSLNGTPLQRTEDNVYHALYNNWLQAYTATKHLPAVLKMVTQGTVMMGARGNIMDAIVKAQNDIKNYIAKDKFKNTFAALSSTEKDTLMQQHTILFQKDFH